MKFWLQPKTSVAEASNLRSGVSSHWPNSKSPLIFELMLGYMIWLNTSLEFYNKWGGNNLSQFSSVHNVFLSLLNATFIPSAVPRLPITSLTLSSACTFVNCVLWERSQSMIKKFVIFNFWIIWSTENEKITVSFKKKKSTYNKLLQN